MAVLDSEIDRRERVGPEALEGGLALGEQREVLDRDRLLRVVLGRVGRRQGDDAIGVRERQALEQPAVDDAEDRRAETDAEAERQDGHPRQGRILEEHPDARLEVARKLLHRT